MSDRTQDPILEYERILMWLCAEIRIYNDITAEEFSRIYVEPHRGRPMDGASISEWERSISWIKGRRHIIAAYADLAGVTIPELWDSALELLPRDAALRARAARLFTPLADWTEAPKRLDALRKLVKQDRASSE
jgi:hypothetical protein